MTAAARNEVERKYEVASSAGFPELGGRGSGCRGRVAKVGDPREHELAAVYLGTPGS